MICFFVSDLHGSLDRYQKLFQTVRAEHPDVLFIGGDLLPLANLAYSSQNIEQTDYFSSFLVKELANLCKKLKNRFPRIFLILGNDDSRLSEDWIKSVAAKRMWQYINKKKIRLGNYMVYGYSYVPPTPFLLKDWEKYDISRYVDPGCISPEDGLRSVFIPRISLKYSTIKKDLDDLTRNSKLENSIFLFHAPPYQTNLDRAALDGKKIDHVPLDVNVGSIAIRRFIEDRQPLLTLHGHIHESSRLSGSWRDRIGITHMFSAAHDGPELSLVRFDPENLDGATRELI